MNKKLHECRDQQKTGNNSLSLRKSINKNVRLKLAKFQSQQQHQFMPERLVVRNQEIIARIIARIIA